jgi:hypothetical protein
LKAKLPPFLSFAVAALNGLPLNSRVPPDMIRKGNATRTCLACETTLFRTGEIAVVFGD